MLEKRSAQLGLWTVVGVAAVFSGVLTIQAVAIDYAANDHYGSIGRATRSENKQQKQALKTEQSMLEYKMRE